jgi:hypothetical protein
MHEYFGGIKKEDQIFGEKEGVYLHVIFMQT